MFGDKMKKKILLLVGFGLLAVFLFLGNSSSDESMEVSGDYDTAYYVEDNGNVFIKVAKLADKCCFYIVDVVISGVGSIFSTILGG